MKKYNTVYAWNLFDEVKNGKKIYAIDRMLVETFDVNSLDVDCFAKLLARAEMDKDRYLFWVIENVIETEEDEGND